MHYACFTIMTFVTYYVIITSINITNSALTLVGGGGQNKEHPIRTVKMKAN